ncbi:leucine-rich repeat protein kinase family protein [Dorcoceras hygrometricum]|uniref:Leucine-rich repeat protein kinase family protein n=1 Tax=Dorcoceras hygrometricum TaxID=472368 RepID=A0A2Z7D8L5_9LAMI|nr:leucine-rich repeat protein kinase family protein [Dorcoceras hygrometricum]
MIYGSSLKFFKKILNIGGGFELLWFEDLPWSDFFDDMDSGKRGRAEFGPGGREGVKKSKPVNSRFRSGQSTVDSDLDSQQSIQIWTASDPGRSTQIWDDQLRSEQSAVNLDLDNQQSAQIRKRSNQF